MKIWAIYCKMYCKYPDDLMVSPTDFEGNLTVSFMGSTLTI